MRDNPNDPSNRMPKRLLEWWQGAKSKGRALLKKDNPEGEPFGEGGGLSGKLRDFDFDFKKIELKNVSEYAPWIRRGLLILGVWCLASVVAGVIGLFVRPSYTALPRRQGGAPAANVPTEDYEAILRRNMFNVEGKIPAPFDQGQLDCFSQAKPTTQRISLLGTIVMSDESRSTALVQDDGSGLKDGVKKDDVFFDGKFVAMKVERKRLCFQVRATQDFEFVQIPEEGGDLGLNQPQFGMAAPGDGISQVSENEFAVKDGFLKKSLGNLTEILQTARAVPNFEPGTGKMNGFLIQSIEPNSPFAQLGLKPNDLLTAVSGIPMDNPGRGLEAFQSLRSASNVTLTVKRGGQDMTFKYDVK